MSPIATRFISSVCGRYPVSQKQQAELERPDLLEAFRDHTAEFSALEAEFGFEYPPLIKDVHTALKDTFVYFDFLSYRQLCLPDEVELGMTVFLDYQKEYGSEWDFWCDRKVPLFSSDGSYDVLDLSRSRQDPPVLFFDPYEPQNRRELFPSVSRYLELLTLELDSGDRFDWDNESIGDYSTRMRSRSTEALLVIE